MEGDLELTIEAIDQWGRRITLNEAFTPSCFKDYIFKKDMYYRDWIVMYLEKIHPNLYSFKITQTNFLFAPRYSEVDGECFGETKYEYWDSENKELARILRLPKKVSVKLGYTIPRDSLPFEHKMEHRRNHKFLHQEREEKKRWAKIKEERAKEQKREKVKTAYAGKQGWDYLEAMYPGLDFSELKELYGDKGLPI